MNLKLTKISIALVCLLLVSYFFFNQEAEIKRKQGDLDAANSKDYKPHQTGFLGEEKNRKEKRESNNLNSQPNGILNECEENAQEMRDTGVTANMIKAQDVELECLMKSIIHFRSKSSNETQQEIEIGLRSEVKASLKSRIKECEQFDKEGTMWLPIKSGCLYEDIIKRFRHYILPYTPTSDSTTQTSKRIRVKEKEEGHDLPEWDRSSDSAPYYLDPKGYPDRNNSIDINYTNIINGMNVSVIWEPIDTIGGAIVGEAIIKFTNKDGENLSIYNSSFGIGGKKRDKIEKDLNLAWVESGDSSGLKFDKKPMHFEYKAPNLKNDRNILNPLGSDDQPFMGGIDEPFFFYDLDFDGNDELIVVLHSAGQRSMNKYKVYALKDGKLADKNVQITDDEPYLQLDGMTTINIINKTINIHGSGGWCNNFDLLYRFNTLKNGTKKGKYIIEEYALTERVQEEEYLNCNSFLYKVDKKQKLTLISKKTLRSTPN